MEVLRVAVISSQFPPLWGGVGSTTFHTVVRLAARGHEVDVVTRRMSPGQEVPSVEGEVRVHQVPMLRLPMLFTTSFAKHAVAKLVELGNDFDVVHSHCNMSLLQRRHYWDIRAPIVSTMHGTWRGERSMIGWRDVTPSLESLNDLAVLYISPMLDVYEDYALRYSNAAITQCDLEMRALRERVEGSVYGQDRLVPLPAGIDADLFHPRNADDEVLARHGAEPGRPTVLFVGRLAARKGVFEALETFHRARGTHPEAQMVVLGSGPQEASLRKRAGRLGIGGAVHFSGSVAFAELRALYATCDVVLFPSFWEGQGLVPGEAMASGTPVVAAQVGWVPELIRQGENGFSHPVRDVATAADQLGGLLDDPGLAREMGKRGRLDILERYEWTHHIRRLEALFETVMGDEKAPAP